MELLSVLALIFVTLAGYSAGVALGARGRPMAPVMLDLLLVIALWTGGVLLRAEIGRWPALGAGLTGGLICGAAHASLRARRRAAQPEEPVTPERTARGWRAFALRLGNFQGRMLMAFFYFIVVTPFALVARIATKPPPREPGSYWTRRNLVSGSEMERARRQY
jgi:hypothetical protein